MRRRALLLVLLAGGLAAAGGAVVGSGTTRWHDSPANAAALARAELADVPAPTALSRARDGIARDLDARRDVAAALGIAVALALTGGWWLARERAARVRRPRPLRARRTRAPPWTSASVHS